MNKVHSGQPSIDGCSDLHIDNSSNLMNPHDVDGMMVEEEKSLALTAGPDKIMNEGTNLHED